MWVQFDCVDCLVLEFNFKAFTICKMDQYLKVETVKGTVNFEKLELVSMAEPIETIKVRRTQDNKRERPNAQNRH